MTREPDAAADGALIRALPPDMRRAEVVRYLHAHAGASIAELARLTGVSAVTIHRDLDRLASAGLVERIQGGARVLGGVAEVSNWAWRRQHAQAEKRAIAVHAASLVEAGTTIFVDSSSTGLAFAEQLARRRGLGLTLVTNSPAIAYWLDAPSIHVVVTPGELHQELRLIGGHWTVEFLTKLKFAASFISGASLHHEQGLGSMTRSLADIVSTARAGSAQTVALVDSSKFGRTSLLQIARLDELDLIVTDHLLPSGVQKEFARAGARLAVARSAGAVASLEPAT
jgi:DeoR/GlpR family transcriptional regulator of sugar metabolism